MGDGASCHECRRYDCICLSSDAIKLVRGIYHFAKLYDDSNPDVGFGSNAERYTRDYLNQNGIEICNFDMRLVKQEPLAKGNNLIVAGTGHRPKYCPCKYQENHSWLLDLKSRLKFSLSQLNPRAVISGMAIGWDTWLAQVALELGIPVWAYVPFKGQGAKWPSSSKKEYDRILKESEKIIYISEEYHSDAFLKRDREMVDNASIVYALWNPQALSGGTYYTVNYANDNLVKVVNFWRD